MSEEVAKDYAGAAMRALAEAEHLVGKKPMTDLDFLKSMSDGDSLIDHDPEDCGQCMHQFIMAQVAREMLKAGDTENGTRRWADETSRRWKESKFVKLFEQLKAETGLDPKKAWGEDGWATKAFKEKGWEP